MPCILCREVVNVGASRRGSRYAVIRSNNILLKILYCRYYYKNIACMHIIDVFTSLAHFYGMRQSIQSQNGFETSFFYKKLH